MGCVGHGAPAGAPSETASRSSESPSAGSPEHAAEQAERLFDGEVIEVIEVDPDLDAGGAPRRAPSPAEGKARPHLNPMVQRHAQRIDDALAAGASFARVGIRTRLGVDEGDLAFERAWAEVVAERAGEGGHPVDQPPPRAGGAA